MRRLLIFVGNVMLVMQVFAGGILTKTNQSAQFVRMLSRNASTDLDAVYFNPAGLTQMENGFYFAFNNQSIFQTSTINSQYPLLHHSVYQGETNAPVFPSAFAVYKTDKWAFSAGFGVNAGGGTTKFDRGLPSFEKQIAGLVPALSGLSALGYPVTDYNLDISFEGSSVFLGIQGGATYKVNKVLSVYLGARYVPGANTYAGSITNIQLGPAGGLQNGKTYLTNAAAVATVKSKATGDAATNLKKLADVGAGTYTFAQAQDAGYITAEQRTQFETGLQQLGLTTAQISGINVNSAQTTFATSSAYLAGTAAALTAKAPALADKHVDTKQTGGGVTPIVGIDIHLDKLNIGLKYEHMTIIGMTNSTKVDDTGLFPDGQKTNSDIPAILAGGASYQINDKLKVSGSGTVFMDKNVYWGKNVYLQERTIDKNFVELSFGAEYKLTDKFALSAGYMNSNTGVSKQFQSDFNFSIDSYTTGLGFQWSINDRLVLDAGMMLTSYKTDTKTFTEAAPVGAYNETYTKDTFTMAFGIGYKIF